jgi:hypothetical protein
MSVDLNQMAKESVKDIRFWILLFFLVRLIGITSPPVETWHSWRQTVVNMTARNYHETGIDLMHPRVDIAGDLTGITGMEFPIYNACIAVMMNVFGEAHWYGRLLNLIAASFGIWFFYRLIRDHVDERTAFLAAMILLGSLWFSMSRKIIPDIFACSLIFIGIERCIGYIKGNLSAFWMLLGIALCSIGVLIKLSVGCWIILLPLSYFLPGSNRTRWWTLNIIQGIALISVVLWYGIWVPHLVETYGYWHFFMGKEMSLGLHEILSDIPGFLIRFWQTPIGYIGFALALAGIFRLIKVKEYALLASTAAVFFLFFLFILKSGSNFILHNYYCIPMIPILAFLAAMGLQLVPKKNVIFILLGVIMLEGILNQLHDFRIKDYQSDLSHLDEIISPYIAQNELIWVNGDGNPAPMYFAHRKGWSSNLEELEDPQKLALLKEAECNAFVFIRTDTVPAEGSGLHLSFQNEWVRIYRWDKPTTSRFIGPS